MTRFQDEFKGRCLICSEPRRWDETDEEASRHGFGAGGCGGYCENCHKGIIHAEHTCAHPSPRTQPMVMAFNIYHDALDADEDLD